MRREFFAQSLELLLGDPPRFVLFVMGHLYLGRSIEPSPSDAGVEDRTVDGKLASPISAINSCQHSLQLTTIGDLPDRKCVTLEAALMRLFFEPALAGFLPRVAFNPKILLVPNRISQIPFKRFRTFLAICATRLPYFLAADGEANPPV